MLHFLEMYILDLAADLANADSNLVLLSIIVVASAIVIDGVSLAVKKKKKETGLERGAVTVAIEGAKSLTVRDYVSEMQGLAGRPDALISEDGFIIPVERKPLARKLRDRYVAQLLVYMRLVEEFEGKKPPYGYLILGPNCRKIKIENSPERQAWLQRILDEMRTVIEGKAALANPHPKKCAKCDVREQCSYAAAAPVPKAASLKLVS